jgi:maltooligosyltrehalose synthase
MTPNGTFAECCISFARQLADQWIVVITPRLSSHVGFPPIGGSWTDTTIELPETLSREHAHDLFTCRPVPVQDRRVKLADALSILPFAVITNL